GAAGSWSHAVVVMLATLLTTTGMIVLVNVRDLLVAGGQFLSRLCADLRFATPRTPFIAALGYVAGLAATVSSPAGLLAVPSMAAMVYVLAEHFRAERDRERAETLFRTAEAAHASIEPTEVAAAITDAARSLLRGEEADLRAEPPAGDEIGVRLDSSEE